MAKKVTEDAASSFLSKEQLEAVKRINERTDGQTIGLASEMIAARPKRRSISTGLPSVDRLLGRDLGIPAGAWSQIYGPRSSGKTLLSQYIIAQAQREGLKAAFMDIEGTFDERYAQIVGVDTTQLLMAWPDDGEEAIKCATDLVYSGVDLIVWDSVGAMISAALIEADPEKSLPAARARLVKRGLMQLNMASFKRNTTHVLINHMVGTMKSDQYGNPIRTPAGGEAVEYYSSCNIHIKPGKREEVAGEVVGNIATIIIEKNKRDRAWGKVELDFEAGRGFDRFGSLISAAIATGVITEGVAASGKGNHLFSFEDFGPVNGADATIRALSSRPDLISRLAAATKEAMRVEQFSEDATNLAERKAINDAMAAYL